jgi:2-desacetyl-2-hydroxyethyl bacteriochlorophyllide A dehydrogenase
VESFQVVFTGRNQVEVQRREIGRQPGPSEVLIETACSMVSPGTELAALTGTHSKSALADPPAWLRYPSVPGYLACGTIAARGAEVRGLAVGQRVVAEGPGVWSSHCGHIVMAEGDPKMVPIPAGVSFEQAVTAKLGSIAMTAIRVLEPRFGDTTAVMGLGVVGQLAARLAVLSGARQVVGIDPVEQRREAARVAGIEAVGLDDPLLESLGTAAAGGRGFDNVIEASGSPEAFLRACEIARVRGKVAVLSSPHRFFQLRLYDQIHTRGLQILGAHGQVLAREPAQNDPWTDGAQRIFFLELLAQGRVRVEPLFTHRVPYTRAPEIYRGLRESPQEYLGVLFYWNGYERKSP